MFISKLGQILSFCVTLLCFIPSAKAQQVVTDPLLTTAVSTSSAAQVAAITKQFGEAIKQTENLVKTVKTLEEQKEAMTGNLLLNTGLTVLFEHLTADYSKMTTALPSKRVGGSLIDNKTVVGTSKLIDDIFSDRTNPRRDVNYPLMKKYRSDSNKAALELSEMIINNASERTDRINQAAIKADSAQDTKDALDVNNHLLIEMLIEHHQTNLLLAQLIRMQASASYNGGYGEAAPLAKSTQESLNESLRSKNGVFDIKSGNTPFKRNGSGVFDKMFGGSR